MANYKKIFEMHPKVDVLYKVGSTFWIDKKQADIQAKLTGVKPEIVKRNSKTK